MTGDDVVFVLKLTPSQRMALLDVIIASMVGPVVLSVYVDVIRGIETTPDELLTLVMNAPPEPKR